MTSLNSRSDANWVDRAIEGVSAHGYVVVEGVLDEAQVAFTRRALYSVQEAIHRDIGQERLSQAGEHGVLRLMMRYDPSFVDLIDLPDVLAVVDRVLSDTAILHLQNGFVLPSIADEASSFQHSFHRDFPRHLNGYVASLNVMITVDPYSEENGGTLVVPGTHQQAERPDEELMRDAAIAVECPPGSMVVFDSTLWHAAGQNRSGRNRLGINQQYTRSFVKQQIDYVRALGDDVIESLKPRQQQLLGWYTRVVTSLDEYYQPSERRLYRSGQG